MKPIPAKLRQLLFNKNEQEPISLEEEKTIEEFEQWRLQYFSKNITGRDTQKHTEADKEADIQTARIWKAVQQNLQDSPDAKEKKIKAVHWTTLTKYAVAAAVMIALGGVAYWRLLPRAQKKPDRQLVPDQQMVVTNPETIQPGSPKAILWLKDNETINITPKLPIGQFARQEEAIISKIQDNLISYVCRHKEPVKASQINNRLGTLAGGEYMITLSDGTRVHLDAGSSLKYPAVFSGPDRRVELEGRARFEVAHNPKKPFIVFVHDKNITAYGTVFTVYAYNKDSVATTLVEGKVTVYYRDSAMKLLPKQKAIMQSGTINIQSNVDTDHEMAWANGTIVLNGKPFKYVMDEIGRWYNIEIEYQTDPNVIHIMGDFPKSTPFKSVYDILNSQGEKEHVQFELKGRKLIVRKK